LNAAKVSNATGLDTDDGHALVMLYPYDKIGRRLLYVVATGRLGLDDIMNWALGSPVTLWLILILPLTWLFARVFALDKLWLR
jgi:hypothetical protein